MSGLQVGAETFALLACRRDQEVQRCACWQGVIEASGCLCLTVSPFTGIVTGAAVVFPLIAAILLFRVMRPMPGRGHRPLHELFWRRLAACTLTLLGVELIVAGLTANLAGQWVIMAMAGVAVATTWVISAHGEHCARRDAAIDRQLALELGHMRIIIPL